MRRTAKEGYPLVLSASCRYSLGVSSQGVVPTLSSNMRFRASGPGNGMYMRFSNRRLMALSSAHGILVAPRTNTPVSSLPTPFIWTRNSVLIRRDASDSPSPRVPHRESTSSIKIIEGFCSRAIWKSCFTSLIMELVLKRKENQAGNTTHRSDSPIHLLTRSEDETAKKVDLASVATAFAR